MRRLLPTLLCCALMSGVPAVLAAPAQAAACRAADALPGSVSALRHARAVRCLVNVHRAAHGLRGVRSDGRLAWAAYAHARDMVRGNFFSHYGRTGSTAHQRAAFFRYGRGRGFTVAEALAYGHGRRGTARSLVRGLLRSPGHRRILLGRRWRDAGVAVVVRGRRATLAADFGRR